MNAIGTYQSNNSSPFKTPLIPLRKGKKAIKSRLEINHHTYNSTINRTYVKDFKSIVLTNKQKSNHTTSSKSLNKRKIFKYTPFQSRNLLVTPAVNMIYNISKRKRDFDEEDEILSPLKRRRLEVKSAQDFHVENISESYRSDTYMSDNEVRRIFEVRDDKRNAEKKIPDQNENLVSFSEELNKCKLQQPVTTSANCLNIEQSSIKIDKKMQVKPVTNFNHSSTELKVVVIPPVDAKLDVVIKKEKENVDIKVMEKMDSLDDKPIIDVKYESGNTNVTSSNFTHSNIKIYAGQLLWARYLAYPYWPSIVCPSDSGAIQDSNELIHVRFCAYKGYHGWVKMNNVFGFDGIESFNKARESMKSKLNKNDYKTAFGAKLNKAWSKAVIEATFILTKAVELRLAFFDVIIICSLRETQKQPNSLSEMISEHSTCSQLLAVEKIFKDNPNICEDIKQEFSRIADVVNFNPSRDQQQTVSYSIKSDKQRRHSVPAVLPSNLPSRRTSVRLASNVRTQLSVSACEVDLTEKEPTTKEKEEQKRRNRFKRLEQKRIEFENDLKLYDMKSYPKNILFQGVRRGNVCKICLSLDDKNDSDLVKCSGSCGDYVHTKCVHATIKKNGLAHTTANILICHECIDMSSPVCYACKKTSSSESKLVRCNTKSCGRYYHTKCLDEWLQTKKSESDKVWCPSHDCHTCVSDDPRNKHYSTPGSKLSRCVKCPTTFHIDSCCIPAGIIILTQTQHICLRHRTEYRKPVNLNWCYICGDIGGTLLCCESCPQTCHISCLNLTVAPEHYFCDGCETRQDPLYGAIVWAKLPGHRWWPSIVVPPFCIPDFVEDVSHHEHDLCVRFFGSYEFGWIGRSFVYLYLADDAQFSLTGERKHDEALTQAKNWFLKLNIKGSGISRNRKVQPKPYHKISNIKALAPAKLLKGESESQKCNCSPDDEDPCGPTSSCANRACLTECDDKLCPCGSKCNNQSIEKKNYASFKRVYMEEKGFGLLAAKPIRSGTLIIEYVGELVTENEFRLRLSTKQTQNFYFMKYDKGLYIDAELKGNMSRFMNHSCNPNCEPQRWSVNGVNRIGLFAIKDILEDTELTFNYEFDDDTHRCYCGENNCTGIIGRNVR